MAKMNVSRSRGGDDDFGSMGAEPTMAAKYAGTCATCGRAFAVGDPIATVLVAKKKTYHHAACRYPASALIGGDKPGKCQAVTNKGKPCGNAPQKGEQLCGPHLTQLTWTRTPVAPQPDGPDPYDEPF
jgi:hypothetical protein